MNQAYLIAPCLLLGAFVLIERAYDRSVKESAHFESLRLVAKKALADAQLAALKKKTADENRARTEAREQDEHARAEKKRLEIENALRAAEADVAARAATIEKLTRESAALEHDLGKLKEKRRHVEDTAFALSRQVELQRIERRTTDLEIQRTTKMVVARLRDNLTSSPRP